MARAAINQYAQHNYLSACLIYDLWYNAMHAAQSVGSVIIFDSLINNVLVQFNCGFESDFAKPYASNNLNATPRRC